MILFFAVYAMSVQLMKDFRSEMMTGLNVDERQRR